MALRKGLPHNPTPGGLYRGNLSASGGESKKIGSRDVRPHDSTANFFCGGGCIATMQVPPPDANKTGTCPPTIALRKGVARPPKF
jgi:hypothetical protein